LLIQTQADAQIALQGLANDIINTKTTQVPQIGVSDGLFGWLGINSPGSSETRDAANSLLDQLAGYVQDMYASLDGSDTPLTAQQVAKLQLIRSQVVDARSTVQSVISDLDWSFGQLVSDSLSAARNLADQAVQGGAKLLGLTWTQVQIVGGLVAGLLVYGLYRRVRG
jgi:hypothetical protein